MHDTVRKERNPDQTRKRILDAAFQEMYHKGFQGMRLEEILAATGLTKGALYHHFRSKRTLGYAVLDEVILPTMESLWLQPLENAADPLTGLIEVIEKLSENQPLELIRFGCPLNNLAQEMSPLDEAFRQRIDHVFGLWQDAVRRTLERARQVGTIRPETDCDDAATFVMAAMEGCIGIAKNSQSAETLRSCNRGLIHYLRSLKN